MMNSFLAVAIFSLIFWQDPVLNNIGAAMKAGSAKELIKYCNENIEIKLNGKASNYSKPQAEVILKDFFLKNPSKNFTYIHQGASPEGLKYTIGSYSVDSGSYRVVMVLKKVKGDLKIDTLNISKE